jgi:hypothetical protein
MPAGSTATITAKAGAATTVTALALTGITDIDFRLANSILQITENSRIHEFDISATTTITATISAGVMALTVSQ